VSDSYLELADWRRRVAQMWEAWRVQGGAGEDTLADATAAFRIAKDVLFREHPQSPLPPPGRRGAFTGLGYWPYDPDWRMTVRLAPAPDLPPPESAATSGPIALPASGASAPSFRRVGTVDLAGPLAGQQLAVYWVEGYGGGLFLPFRDATNGAETYAAGRYLLDTIKGADAGGDPDTGELVLDFNMAYFPSCAYDARWSCPLAPPENRLPVPVPAGERLAAS
jgi:uncharacterized protein (DUF1684 family)